MNWVGNMSVELTNEQAKIIGGCVQYCLDTRDSSDLSMDLHKKLIKALTPKLAEPTNFGAVVRHENGVLWQLVKGTDLKWGWRAHSSWGNWKDIKNPTLIYEGVEE